MKFLSRGLLFWSLVLNCSAVNAQNKLNIIISEGKPQSQSGLFHEGKDLLIQYTGRIEYSADSLPRFWAPGVYATMKIKGPVCEIFLNDEVLYGSSHNYIEVIVDKSNTRRLQTKWKNNVLKIEGLDNKAHTITICKNSESGIGYLELAGINCTKLLNPEPKPLRKIEFIGNSITCGNAMDLSEIACGKGQWYDQQNAYMSYGPVTARSLTAQWVLSSVSGIGMIHSCCNMDITMPEVFDKINMRNDSLQWNFNSYIPDVVTICLGQNDGIQDSAAFCNAYIHFIETIRSEYSNAAIICLNSPMADLSLNAVLKNYITSIVAAVNHTGDKNVFKYFFSRSYNDGCGGHPDLKQHQLIAAQLAEFIKHIEGW